MDLDDDETVKGDPFLVEGEGGEGPTGLLPYLVLFLRTRGASPSRKRTTVRFLICVLRR